MKQPSTTAAYCRAEIARALSFSESILGNTLIVVDNSNMFLAGRAASFRIDYTAVRQFLGGDALLGAVMVASQPHFCMQNWGQEAFYRFLQHNGWQVDRFLCEQQVNGALTEKEMLVDGRVRDHLYAAASNNAIDSIVLLSADGGNTNAVKANRRAHKNVYVVAWQGSANPALIAAATAFSTVEDLRTLIGRVLH